MMRWIGIGGGLLVLLLAFGYVLGIRGWGMMHGGMMHGDMMHRDMMGREGTQEAPQETDAVDGESLFRSRCAACHPGGGNTIMPELPLRGAPQLADFDTFMAFIRDPRLPDGSRGPMPPFSADMLTRAQAKSLYHYIFDVINRTTRK